MNHLEWRKRSIFERVHWWLHSMGRRRVYKLAKRLMREVDAEFCKERAITIMRTQSGEVVLMCHDEREAS